MEHTLTLSRATAALRQHGLLLSAPHCPQERTFPALTYDSRAVAPGARVVCKGRHLKPEYLQKALEAGAACYVAEQPYDNAAPALLVSDVRRALSVLAAEYYGHPAEQLTLIGLTGTKGKTTTTYFIKNILDTALGHRTAVLSTVEMYTGGESRPSWKLSERADCSSPSTPGISLTILSATMAAASSPPDMT